MFEADILLVRSAIKEGLKIEDSLEHDRWVNLLNELSALHTKQRYEICIVDDEADCGIVDAGDLVTLKVFCYYLLTILRLFGLSIGMNTGEAIGYATYIVKIVDLKAWKDYQNFVNKTYNNQ